METCGEREWIDRAGLATLFIDGGLRAQVTASRNGDRYYAVIYPRGGGSGRQVGRGGWDSMVEAKQEVERELQHD